MTVQYTASINGSEGDNINDVFNESEIDYNKNKNYIN